MICALVFELVGALAVGARTADTIKNGIIPNTAFQKNAGVQMLAFTCALGGAASWVMWCTRHSAHVSSTYSLISAVAGVGVAVAGADKVVCHEFSKVSWAFLKVTACIAMGLEQRTRARSNIQRPCHCTNCCWHFRCRNLHANQAHCAHATESNTMGGLDLTFLFPHCWYHLYPVYCVQRVTKLELEQEARLVRCICHHGYRSWARIPCFGILRSMASRQSHQKGLHTPLVRISRKGDLSSA